MTYIVGEQLNNYFKAAKYGVPDPDWLDFKDLRKKPNNTSTLRKSPAKITEILNPNKRKREDSRDTSSTEKQGNPYGSTHMKTNQSH